MKVRTTILLKLLYNENEKESSFSIHRGKFKEISINNGRLSYKTIRWRLNARDTPHFKLDILDAGSLYTQAQGVGTRTGF